ncbi:MAG: polyprenyl diphosphate synthase [bacterium]|nr:polyprenyl diphosphate synthase [bacterium]
MDILEPDHSVKHLGIIMDGNRRWAKENDLTSFKGHYHGYQQLINIVKHAQKIGIKVLTVFAFSSENWKRTPDEVTYLIGLFSESITEQSKELIAENVRVRFIGEIGSFPESLQKQMMDLTEQTKDFTGLTFNICASYGGRAEILNAIRTIHEKGIDPTTLTEDEFSNYLYTDGQPYPDMIIRTSGEQRLSNFLTWQNVYSELYFADVHWPDFTPDELDKAIVEFSRRQRRFGK